MRPTKPLAIAVTGDYDADLLISTDPLSLLLAMLLDQQVPMEKAFRGPYDLKVRMGGRLDACEIAGADSEALAVLFKGPPVLHRYPGSMAGRTQDLCRALMERFEGDAERVWSSAATGQELLANLKALPGFGEQKARIFTALLAKRMEVTPPGWEEAAGPYAQVGHFSVADIDGPEALARVREHKKAMKAAAKVAPSPMKP